MTAFPTTKQMLLLIWAISIITSTFTRPSAAIAVYLFQSRNTYPSSVNPTNTYGIQIQNIDIEVVFVSHEAVWWCIHQFTGRTRLGIRYSTVYWGL